MTDSQSSTGSERPSVVDALERFAKRADDHAPYARDDTIVHFRLRDCRLAREALNNPGAALAEPTTVAADLDSGGARPNRRLDSADRGHLDVAQGQSGCGELVEIAAKAMYDYEPWEDGTTWETMPEASRNAFRETMRFVFASLPAVNKGEGDGYRAAWLELLGFCNTLKAERFRLEQTIRDSIEALERNSTSAPVVECLKAAIDATPQPASNAGGETWTADGFWQFVGGLAGKFEADQMRDMLGQHGPADRGYQRFRLRIAHAVGLSPTELNEMATEAFREAALIAEKYSDCGGDFIAQKIRDRALFMPSTNSPTASPDDRELGKLQAGAPSPVDGKR